MEGITNYGNIVVHFICLCTCLIVVSGMDFYSFMLRYINIMLLEIIVSLICFTYVVLLNGESLPLEYSGIDLHEGGAYNIVYLTPYYTIGWLATGGAFRRNSGIFWESGAHAIFINLAILFYFVYNHQKNVKPIEKYKLLIFIIALLTTTSTSGFIEFVLIIGYVLFEEGNQKAGKSKSLVIILGLIIITIGILGGVFDKIIYKIGSFGDRSRDLIGGLKVSLINPILGLGYFSSKDIYYSEVGIVNMSNGLIALIISLGWIVGLAFLYLLFKEVKRLFAKNDYQAIVVFAIFVVFYMSEPIMQYVIFLSFICGWEKENQYV